MAQNTMYSCESGFKGEKGLFFFTDLWKKSSAWTSYDTSDPVPQQLDLSTGLKCSGIEESRLLAIFIP